MHCGYRYSAILLAKYTFVLTLSLILFCSQAQAQTILAGDIKISTPTYKPKIHPLLGTYTYEVSWQGIPAAEVKVGVEKPADEYQIWTRVRTYGLVDIFYKLRYNADATLNAADFQPQRSYFYHRENSRIKETTLTFGGDGVIRSVHINRGVKQDYSFNPENFTLDPFSASFIARGVNWSKGASFQFDAFNGKSRYLITLTATDLVTERFGKRIEKVWVIEPHVKNLTSTKPSKLRHAHIYLTADDRREIIEIESEVWIGSVRTKLISFEPSTKSVSGTQLAMQPVKALASKTGKQTTQ